MARLFGNVALEFAGTVHEGEVSTLRVLLHFRAWLALPRAIQVVPMSQLGIDKQTPARVISWKHLMSIHSTDPNPWRLWQTFLKESVTPEGGLDHSLVLERLQRFSLIANIGAEAIGIVSPSVTALAKGRAQIKGDS
jgi:hypothetical protein